MKNVSIVTAFATFACLAACSSDAPSPQPPQPDAGPTHAAAPPSCKAIIEACHPLDIGEGPIHDCHEIGHGGAEAACESKKDECLKTCTPSDGGALDDAGDAGLAHGHDDTDASAEP